MFNSRDLFLKSADPIVLIDNREVIDCNEAAMLAIGLKQDDFPLSTRDLFRNFPFNYRLYTSFHRKIYETYQWGRNTFRFSPNQDIVFEISLTLVKDEGGKDIIFTFWKKHDLSVNDEKLLDVLKIANLATWEFRIKENVLVINARFCELIGNPASSLVLKAEEYLEKYVAEEDRPLLINSMQEVIDSNNPDFQANIEYHLIKNGGERMHVMCNARKRNDSLFGTLQDITHLRRTEKELEEYRLNLENLVEIRTHELKRSEEKLSDALSLAKLGTWEFDFSLNCFIVSKEVLKILGTSKKKEGGRMISIDRFKSLMHPDDWHIYYQAGRKAIKSRDENYLDHFEFRIIRDDGEEIYLYFSLKIIVDPVSGYHYKHYGTLQDITAIRRAEAERQRLNEIIEATTDIVAIIDKDENLFYLNQSGQNFFDIPVIEEEEESIYSKKYDTSRVKGNVVELLLKDKLKEIKGSHSIWSGENTIIGKDEQKTVVSQVIIPHVSGSGEVNFYSTIIRDITRQKKTELDLIFKNNELDTFVYRASHDLRGPLASLLGLYSVIKYEVTDPVSLEYFEMINSQILKLNKIIISLIELTKIKEVETRKTVIEFEDIIEESLESLKHLPHFFDVDFNISIDTSREFISDYDLTKTILQALLENAVIFAKPDVPPKVHLSITEKPSSDQIVITVKDNGIGIDRNIQDKIFNMFFRGHIRSRGSGLGLYLLKNAVEKLNGKIYLESDASTGTSFKVELPNLAHSSLVPL